MNTCSSTTPERVPARLSTKLALFFFFFGTMPQAWQVYKNVKDASRQSPEAVANLELHDVAKPVPGPKAVLIRIHAGQ